MTRVASYVSKDRGLAFWVDFKRLLMLSVSLSPFPTCVHPDEVEPSAQASMT